MTSLGWVFQRMRLDSWSQAMTQESLSNLVGSIYRAAEEPECWPLFLDAFSESVNSRQTLLIMVDLRQTQSAVSTSVRADPEELRDYRANWSDERNPYLASKHPLLRRSGSVVRSAQLLPDEERRKTPYFHEFERRYHMDALVGLNIHVEGPVLAAVTTHFHGGGAGRVDEAVDLGRILMPHLRRSLSLHMALADGRRLHAGYAAALETERLGSALIDDRGRLLHANPEAERILRAQDGLTIRFGHLCGLTSKGEDELQRLIRLGAEKSGGVGAIQRQFGQAPLQVTACPLASEGPLRLSRASTILLIRDPQHRPRPSITALRRLFGLTRAEATVAFKLAEEKSRPQIAAELGVSENTIRTHVKSIYRKASVRNRAAFLRMLPWES